VLVVKTTCSRVLLATVGLESSAGSDGARAARAATGLTADADLTPTSRLLADERMLDHARWWLAEVGFRAVLVPGT